MKEINFWVCRLDRRDKKQQTTIKMLTHHNKRNLTLFILLSVLISLITHVKCDDANYNNNYDRVDDEANFNDNNNDEVTSEKLLNIQKVQYSSWNRSDTYLSSTTYNARGMAPLYNITNMVIDLFVDDDEPIPRGESRRRNTLITPYDNRQRSYLINLCLQSI